MAARKGCRVGQKMSYRFSLLTKRCLHYKKHLFHCARVLELKFSFQYQNLTTDVLVTSRPPCLCPSEGRKHGVSAQSAINFGDSLLRIAREGKTADTWFSARLFILQSPIMSQIHEFNYWMVTIFTFDHMTGQLTGENRELELWQPYLSNPYDWCENVMKSGYRVTRFKSLKHQQ